MGDTVFINGLSAVHAGSPGQSLAFPDVNLCPPSPPAGPVPVPLPNLAKAADLAGGATSVTIGGNPMAKKSSYIARSTGNAVARTTGGGLMTHVVEGQARFVSHSMTVMVEGEPVPRHLDMMTHNHAAMPGEAVGCYMGSMAIATAPAAAAIPEPIERRETRPITFEITAEAAGWTAGRAQYRLRSDDGRYNQLATEAGRKGADLLSLAFRNVLPGKRYTLVLEQEGEPFSIFADVPFALLQEHQETAPRNDARAVPVYPEPTAAPPPPASNDALLVDQTKDDAAWYEIDALPVEKP